MSELPSIFGSSGSPRPGLMVGAAGRSRLHAPGGRGADHCCGRGRHHGVRHGARLRRERAAVGALRGRGPASRVVTKGGMGEGWVLTARENIRADCERSLAELGGVRSTSTCSMRPIRVLRGRLGARARPARRRRARRPRRPVERQPAATGGGTRARSHRSSGSRALSTLRRPRTARRHGQPAAPSWALHLIAHSPLGGPRRARKLANAPRPKQALAWLSPKDPT